MIADIVSQALELAKSQACANCKPGAPCEMHKSQAVDPNDPKAKQAGAKPGEQGGQNGVEPEPKKPTLIGRAMAGQKRKQLAAELDRHKKYLHKATDELGKRGQLGLDEFVGAHEHLKNLAEKHIAEHPDAFTEGADEHRQHAANASQEVWQKHLGKKAGKVADVAELAPDEAKDRGKKTVRDEMAAKSGKTKPKTEDAKKQLAKSRTAMVALSKSLYGDMADAPDPADLLRDVLAMLLALRQNHHSTHWQSNGPVSYSDHQLFDRLYGDALGSQIDDFGEKIVARYGNAAVDAARLSWMQAGMVSDWQEVNDPVARALASESAVRDAMVLALSVLNADGSAADVEMDNFLRGLIDAHGTAVYLLKQRLGMGAVSDIAQLAKSCKVLAKSEGDEADDDGDEDEDLDLDDDNDTPEVAAKKEQQQEVANLEANGVPATMAKDIASDDDSGDKGDDDGEKPEPFEKSWAVLAAAGRLSDYGAIVRERENRQCAVELEKSRKEAYVPPPLDLNFQSGPSFDCDPMSVRVAVDEGTAAYIALGVASGSKLYTR